MRGYHCCNTPRRTETRVPHASVSRVRGSYAERFETLLWTRRSALPHFQLLSAVFPAPHKPGGENLSSGPPPGRLTPQNSCAPLTRVGPTHPPASLPHPPTDPTP